MGSRQVGGENAFENFYDCVMISTSALERCDGCVEDSDGDGVVGVNDLFVFICNWDN